MIQEKLIAHFRESKLLSSYLVVSDNTDKAYTELGDFLIKYLFHNINDHNSKDISNNPDISIVKSDDKTSLIKADQIRKLREFLNTTSPISGIKIGVIIDAANMNISAFNSCLKFLEDTPNNSYLFLITKYATLIPDTILSRCAKLYQKYDPTTNIKCKDSYITLLLDQEKPTETKLQLIQKISANIEAWNDFVDNIEILCATIAKHNFNVDMRLSDVERKFFQQISKNTESNLLSNNFLHKYDKIQNIIHNVRKDNLDLITSTIMIIDIMQSI